jgi:hypothetical protein
MVRNLTVTGVRAVGSTEDIPIDRLVRVIEQKVNPDYSKLVSTA